MPTYIHVELPHPFKTTTGPKMLYVVCGICDDIHPSQYFFPRSSRWESPTYRWDSYADLGKMKCPSCGASVPKCLGGRILNFLMEMAYDCH
ncbi:hypothetical protein LCGC14_0318600 [marine sediment metagenome]|uniref:Uncharacterized protein n=1 Tax=marine sediment metagenome TaxID=412755 RepID=A0A0F9U2P9_9ZZZZ